MRINEVGAGHDLVKAGEIQAGDLIGYYHADVTTLTVGGEDKRKPQVQWEGDWYEAIGRPQVFRIAGDPIYKKQAFARASID